MSAPLQKDKFTPELRILVASLLSFGVIILWAKYFGPKPPVQPSQSNRPAVTAPATTAPAASSAVTPSQAMPAPATIAPAKTASAALKSWQLKHYKDDAKPQRVLDVVHPEASQQTGGWPFSVVLDDEQLQNAANGSLYQLSSPATTLQAPAEAEFSWSDGHLEVTKHFRFDHTYVVRVETSVKFNGAPVVAGISWLGGFGDLTVTNPAPIDTVSVFHSENGKLTNIMAKKLEGPEKWPNGVWQGGKDWTGIQDRYFTAAFLPANGAAPGTLEARYWKIPRTVQVEGKDTDDPVPQIVTGTSAQPVAMRIYVGPKDYDELKKINPPLNALVNFGWFEFIADPLFHALKWLHSYIPNWGWAIVVLTLIINMLLFPLKYTGYKTSLKMKR